MSYAVGIDLGTTSSRISVLQDGIPVIIENIEGEGTTPSHVAISRTGQLLVGNSAKIYAMKDPENVIYSIKRLIGRRFNDSVIQRLISFAPYKILEERNGGVTVILQGKQFTPEELTAFTMGKLKKSAETYLREEITHAVIAVPAYFNTSQRKSTIDAAKIAGLNVLRLYTEPTLAAVSYGFKNRHGDRKIAVYDLGGGTFDISVVEACEVDGELQFEVLSTNGDTFLGGEDFDLKIVNYIASDFKKNHSIDLMSNSVAIQRLKEAAENAKISLSTNIITEIDLPFIDTDSSGPKHLNYNLTRKLLEELISEDVKHSIDICKKALSDAGCTPHDIQNVILVGGSTRIPLVHDSLVGLFCKEPLGVLRREDLVALGAAIQAGVITGNVNDVLLLDALPFSISIETSCGKARKIFERNTIVPIKDSEVFIFTGDDNQSTVSVHIFEGKEELGSNITSLGHFDLTVPNVPGRLVMFEVDFSIEGNGVLHVKIGEEDVFEHPLRTQRRGGLCDNEVEEFSRRFDSYRDDRVLNNNSELQTNVISHIQEENITKNKYVESYNSSAFRKIFISYAHEDFSWAQSISKTLSIMSYKKNIEIYIDRTINAGEKWEEAIYENIENSNVAILLVSRDFLTSNFILKNELPRIFTEKERRYLRVYPIMVRHCPYALHEELSKFQFFNDPKIPYSSLKEWEIEKELTELAYDIANNRIQATPKPRI